jgi:hypothetical protein
MALQVPSASQTDVSIALHALAVEVDNLRREFVALQKLRETVAKAERTHLDRAAPAG